MDRGAAERPDAHASGRPDTDAGDRGPATRWQAWADGPWLHRIAPPFVSAGVVAAVILLFFNDRFGSSVKLVLGYVFTPVGKEAWLAAGETDLDLPLAYVVVLLWLVEASVALFFALVPPVERILERLPRLGRRVARWEARIHASRSAQYGLGAGLALLVATPIHSGGAILGPVVGRSLGLWWYQAYAAVMVGTTIRFAAVAGAIAAFLRWIA